MDNVTFKSSLEFVMLFGGAVATVVGAFFATHRFLKTFATVEYVEKCANENDAKVEDARMDMLLSQKEIKASIDKLWDATDKLVEGQAAQGAGIARIEGRLNGKAGG
jgi:hypothetical protein